MKAFTQYTYGGPDKLQLNEVDEPTLEADHVLVKIKANSANPADWHIIRGEPFFARFTYGLLKPKRKIPGADFAGIIEAVGSDVSHFKVGDRVLGSTLKGGAFAEYVCLPAVNCGLMPEKALFPEMASVPMAGVTALQALITHGQLKEGETVLINGSTGGVGHFAVQIAKAYGGHVTAVCSYKNFDFVKQLGADHVIVYDMENIHHHEGKYDLIIDVHGSLSYKDYKRMGRRGVMVGFTTMKQMMSLMLKKMMGKFLLEQFTVNINTEDIEVLASLIQQQRIKPYIERTYSYEQIPEAITYIEALHTRGKVVMTW